MDRGETDAHSMTRRTRTRRDNAIPDEKGREVIDGKTGLPDPAPRRIDLSNLRDVRLEMAEVYRRVDRKEIESQDGSRRVFMLRQIADVIVNADLERRIAELEGQHQAASTGRAAAPGMLVN